MAGDERLDAVVAGAGPAGLAVAAVLARRGLDVVVLERTDGVGARWRDRYAGLRLNTMRQLSGLPGLRIPRGMGRYPSREDYVAYLERYVEHHRLRVLFGTGLERVDREGDGLWRLQTTKDALLARHAVVATGYDAVPRLPEWAAGADDDRVVHAADVRDPADFAGRDVLIVGAGNTGIDLAGLLLAAGADVTVAMRTPPNVFPRELWGFPLQLGGLALERLPARLGDVNGFVAQRLAFGDLSGHGLPRAPAGFQTTFRTRLIGAAIDDGFVAALKTGRTRIVACVERLDGEDVVLVDGTRLRPDAVICATGYGRGLEPIVGHLGVLRPDGLPIAYDAAPEHPAAPRLYFAGFYGSNAGQLRLMPIHARRIARAVARHDRALSPRAGRSRALRALPILRT